jgi:protein Tex
MENSLLEKHIPILVQELQLRPAQVAATAVLLEEGATVPFIARYRKERTGELDEVQITSIRDRLEELKTLEARRTSIVDSLRERNLLSDELAGKINQASTLSVLEDLYLPFRPKKRTKAIIARERGLDPLAEILWAQEITTDPLAEAAAFVSAEKEVPDAAAALAGARDILAERINSANFTSQKPF